jgi:deazaflavin-dependent oxidoreductase (nitroreductase family)
MSERRDGRARVPPRWFVRTAWYLHRAVYRVTAGRLGLWLAGQLRWGTLRLTTVGRRTGRERSVILGYLQDGDNLVTMAMNGWADGEPAWWLNLRAHPDAHVALAKGSRAECSVLVRARVAEGDERHRLWQRWLAIQPNLDAYAALRSTETTVVVLEPRPGHR